MTRLNLALVLLSFTVSAMGQGGDDIRGPLKFTPLTDSVAVGSLPDDAPFAIPAGFSQTVIWDEQGRYSAGGDVYAGQNDWPDMNQVNARGKFAGRYLYTSHEVRANIGGGPHGAVSVLDLWTGEKSVLAQVSHWEAIDGLIWTPWKTLLTAEEASFTRSYQDPTWPARHGLLYEITLDPRRPDLATETTVRPALGSIAHEGIGIDKRWNVYVIDEYQSSSSPDSRPDGAVYRFVPDRPGDLSSGTLYALRVIDEGAAPGIGTGTAEWVALIPGENGVTMDPRRDARMAAQQAGVTTYRRPEDVEVIGDVLYVATTADGRVIAIDLGGGAEPFVYEFVAPGVNVPAEDAGAGIAGLARSDNLASDHAGNLYICEDNSPGDIWVATPDRDHDGYADTVALFASLSTPGAEPTGIFVGKDPHAMFVNVQHASNRNDKTIVIRKQLRLRDRLRDWLRYRQRPRRHRR